MLEMANDFKLQPKVVPTHGQIKLKPQKKQDPEELAKLDNATPEELFARWQQKQDPAIGGRLLKSLQPSIEQSVRKYTGSSDPIAMGEARSLVIDALPRYDPNRGVQLQTYVDRQLQPLQRWKSRKNIGIKVPTGVVQDIQRVNAAEQQLSDDLGRNPSLQEIADHSGLSLERINKIQRVKYPVIAEKETSTSDGDVLHAADQAVQAETDMWYKTVYHSLNGIDQVIMEHTVGLYGAKPMSNQEIARKLKISPGAVSQRKAKIQALLDNPDDF